MSRQNLYILLFSLILTPQLSAQVNIPNLNDNVISTEESSEVYKQYYTIDESNKKIQSGFSQPLQVLNTVLETTFQDNVFKDMNLLRWIRHNKPLNEGNEPYNRRKHFGTWIKDPSGTCKNTRAIVLERDSLKPVEYADSKKCRVTTGLWHDPFSGQEFTDARDMEIDHFVPLKNAYRTGAWKWDGRKRCLYANYTSNPYHLIAVLGNENGAKGDRGPEGYLPPNQEFTCAYLQRWLKVKLIWSLAMTPPESEAIHRALNEYNCKAEDLQMTKGELEKQREYMRELSSVCDGTTSKSVADNLEDSSYPAASIQ
ncbi:MAG: hypothetical protein BroJett040_11500 [Oligoflexia bacterium]|nr:MAG: hypothetical protein BroJett040_11500 [Oligoflexia bacterium]